MDVYVSFIHNCKNLNATKMFFIMWMDKLKSTVVHLNNGILLRTKKKQVMKPYEKT
jgi:hypothetical protein